MTGFSGNHRVLIYKNKTLNRIDTSQKIEEWNLIYKFIRHYCTALLVTVEKKTSQTVRQRMNKVLMSILFNGGFYQMVIEDFFLKFVTLLFLKLSNIIRHDQRIIHVHFRLLNYIRLYFCMEVRKAKLLIVIRQIKLNYL